MIVLDDWSTEGRELDFSSAGLPSMHIHSILVNGEILCNAYELTDWEVKNDRMQLIVCEHCGMLNCRSGGWVTFRRAEKEVFVIPLFPELSCDDEWLHSEYGPPDIIHRWGVLRFKRGFYQAFVEAFPKFPEYECIPPMTYLEALLVFQLETPGQILGNIYNSAKDPKRLNLVLAASEGDAGKVAKQVARIFDRGPGNEQVAIIKAPEPGETAVTLYVDLPEVPEWNVFWKGKSVGLYLTPEHRLEIVGEPRCSDCIK